MLARHITFSAYGFWPSNDPRGSGSSRVRAQHLYAVGGAATKVDARRSVAGREHDRQLGQRIRENLKFPPVTLTGHQARAIGRAIGTVCPKIDLVVFALAVLPNHVHLVVREHHFEPDELIACLQRAATRQLNAEDLHPFVAHRRPNGKLPTPWTQKGWTVFLDTDQEVRHAIQYVEFNPEKDGLPRQHWSCVVPFE